MSGEELKAMLDRTGLASKKLAEWCEVTPTTMSLYAKGTSPVPKHVERIVRRIDDKITEALKELGIRD